MRTKHDRFNHRGVVICRQCHKPTRETGEGESQLELCKPCLYEAYAENAASDYGEGSPEHTAALEQLAKVRRERGLA